MIAQRIGRNIRPETERNARDFQANWDLVNAVDELCHEFHIEHDGIYEEDVYVALERVKWHWLVEHTESRIQKRLKKLNIELPEYDG